MLTNLGAGGQHWQKERNACSREPAGLQTPARQKSPSHTAGITPLSWLGISMSLVCAAALPTQHPHQLSEALPYPRGRWHCGWDAYPVLALELGKLLESLSRTIISTGHDWTWSAVYFPEASCHNAYATKNLKKMWPTSSVNSPSSISSPSASNPSPGKLFGRLGPHEQHTPENSALFCPHSTKQVEQLGAQSKKPQQTDTLHQVTVHFQLCYQLSGYH